MPVVVNGIRAGGSLDRYGDYLLHGQWQFDVPSMAVPQSVTAATLAPNVHVGALYMLARATATAVTMGAPAAGSDDGLIFEFQSDSAIGHTITFTGSTLDTGSAAALSATFNPFKGACLRVRAYNGRWKVCFALGVSFS